MSFVKTKDGVDIFYKDWRVGLVASELITNAARHGLPPGKGKIFIFRRDKRWQVVCRVNDNGTVVAGFRPGLGTRLVNALAMELEGQVERRLSENGATITVTFPAQSHRARSAATLTAQSRNDGFHQFLFRKSTWRHIVVARAKQQRCLAHDAHANF